MRTITGLKFNIGTLEGEYPAGSSVTDSIFELASRAGAMISSITYESQSYSRGWNLNGRRLEFSTLFNTSNGNTIYVNFDQTISIG